MKWASAQDDTIFISIHKAENHAESANSHVKIRYTEPFRDKNGLSQNGEGEPILLRKELFKSRDWIKNCA